MKTLQVKFTLLEGMLGTNPCDENVYSAWVASKNPDKGAAEMEVTDFETPDDIDEETVEKAPTVFIRDDDGDPAIYDYLIRGFFKDACSALRRVKSTKSSTLTSFKKVIDGLVFVEPRKIKLVMPEGGKVTFLERPIRAQTAQGERTALVSSEEVPTGTTFECTIVLFDDSKKNIDLIKEWLDYGKFKGFGQWRNSGKGRFDYEILCESLDSAPAKSKTTKAA